MRAESRWLVIDRVRRYWWVWALLGVFQIATVVLQALAHASYYYDRHYTPFTVAALVLFPVLILNNDQQRWRWLQGALTLPVSRPEAGLALWWVGIGFPTLLIALMSVLGVLAAMVGAWSLDIPYPFVDAGFQLSLWGHVGLGVLGMSAGFALTMLAMPVGPVGLWPDAAALARAAIAVPVGLAAMFFPLNIDTWPVLAFGTMAAGLLAALYLHMRPGDLVLRRLGRVPAAALRWPKRRPTPDLAARASGWTVIAGRVARRLLWSVLALAVFLALWRAAAYVTVGRFEFGEAALWDAMTPMLVMVALFVAPMLSLQWISAARVLRALPLTADRLAGVLLALTCAPTVVLLLALVVVHALVPRVIGIVALPFALLAVPPQPLFVPFTLRFGERGWRGICVFYALLIAAQPAMSGPISPFGGAISAHAAAWVVAELALTAVLGVVGYLWARHELRSGRRAFRPLVQSAWPPVTWRGAR